MCLFTRSFNIFDTPSLKKEFIVQLRENSFCQTMKNESAVIQNGKEKLIKGPWHLFNLEFDLVWSIRYGFLGVVMFDLRSKISRKLGKNKEAKLKGRACRQGTGVCKSL